MKGFLRSLAAAVAALEGPLLVFPVLLIEIVAATFLFPGGRCGAWQWWLAVAGTVAWAYGRAGNRRSGIAAAAGALLLLAPVALRMAYRVDDAHAILLLETRTPSPACVVAADLDPGQSIPPGIPEPALGANLLLLAREDPWIARAACPPDGTSSADLYARFPANGLAVSPDCDVAAASARHRLFALPDRRARLAATPRFLLSTAFVTLPDTLRLCVSRLFFPHDPRGC